jgi:hypothetical protein
VVTITRSIPNLTKMLQQGVGYTYTNSPGGASLVIDPVVLSAPNTPFRVYEDSTAEGQAILRVSAGTFNNSFPTVAGVIIGEPAAYLPAPSGDSIVYLTIPASQSTGAPFPAGSVSVTLASGSTIPTNTASTAYVGLAKVKVTPVPESTAKVYTFNQLVTGSLWGERFECGSQLDYWFSQI